MKIKEVMSRDPYVCDPDTPISEIASWMRDLDVGMIPVCDGRKLRGMVTDRDIVIRAVAEEMELADTLAEDVMSAEVTYCFQDDDVEEASELMEKNQIRRLVVLDEDKMMVGIVSLGDIALKVDDDELTSETLEEISRPASGIHVDQEDNDDEFTPAVIDSERQRGAVEHG